MRSSTGNSREGLDMRVQKQTPIVTLLTSFALLASMFTGTVSSTPRAQRKADQQTTKAKHPYLSRYAIDLTKLARQGRLATRANHYAELNRAIKLLAEDGPRNPVLIDDSGANVQTLAESLAKKIAAGRVPASLQNKQVFSINLDALSANAKDSAEFVARLQAVLAETAEARGQIILVVDQLHQFVGSYADRQATAAIREALEHRQYNGRGTATPEAYGNY